MANKPEIKKKERIVEKKRKGEKNKTTTLSEKKEEARNVSKQQDRGWIHVIRVQDTLHSVDNNMAGQQTLTNYHTQRKNERFVKHRDYPPHSYTANERYNSRNKRASQEKKTVNGKNRQLAQTQTQGGHESLVYWTRTNKPFSSLHYDETNKAKLGNKIKHPIKGRLPHEV